jgi:ketosteroid isomerase-like protein
MTTEQTRDTMKRYTDALLAFGDYGRYLSDDVTMKFMGTDREVKGYEAVRQAIDFFHQTAFTSAIELKSLLCGDGEAILEAEFIGIHIGEFEGVAATLRPVRLPYSVAYTLAGGRITALRLYFPFELLMRQLAGIETPVAAAR